MTRYIDSGHLEVLPAGDPAAPPRSQWDADLRPAGPETPSAGEAETWLPVDGSVTVGYVAGPESVNRGEDMVARGPTEEIVELLARAGYMAHAPVDK